MKVSMMSLADVTRLRDRLDGLINAAAMMDGVAEGVMIDLTPGRPVTIHCAWSMPPFADVEPETWAGATAAVEFAATGRTDREAETPDPEPAAAFVPTARGPLTDQERQTIISMAKQGAALAQVAAALHRQPVTVATAFKRAVERRDMPEPVAPVVVEEVPPAPAAIAPLAAAEDLPSVTAPAPYLDLPLGQRALAQDLDRLRMPKGWSAALDMDLAVGIASGHKLDMLAADLGVDSATATARYSSLTRTIRDPRNRVTIDGQKHLLAEVRRRTAVALEAAE